MGLSAIGRAVQLGMGALVVFLVVGGCGGKQDHFSAADEAAARFEARAAEVIRDEARLEEALAVLGRWRAAIDELAIARGAYLDKIVRMNADPATTRAALEEEARRFEQERSVLIGLILDERDALIRLTTAEEWLAMGGTAS